MKFSFHKGSSMRRETENESASGGSVGQSSTRGSGRRVQRCTFTLPTSDEALIADIQELADGMGLRTPTRSEVVRAALKHLGWANERKFREAFESLERVKTGRPPRQTTN
ncbi:hypothetical protein [Thiohalorhabdus methylotrophus]|uniref:Ribbon-helix-helix protein CopG domain-containing protein n=1 Tax=Thiohalorhabdus methylotrophus TaxID=3242694 RepID=A0ABV4TXQ5_9GAMM